MCELTGSLSGRPTLPQLTLNNSYIQVTLFILPSFLQIFFPFYILMFLKVNGTTLVEPKKL